MLCLRGVDSKVYWTLLARGRPMPQIPCPDPSCGDWLKARGWYWRYLDGKRVPLRRLRCSRCGVSHALLPEDVCAYNDLTLPVLEVAMGVEDGPSAAARATDQPGPSGRRRVRLWLRGSSWQGLSFLLPGSGSAWERIVAIFGEAPGKLIRLRHWLSSKLGFFFGGPAGLFRHGRPSEFIRGLAP